MRKALMMILLVGSMSVWGKTDSTAVYQGFSGGMMLHAGYLFGQDKNAPVDGLGRSCSPQGATFGIGGALRVNLWKHLRVGGEGFVSTMSSVVSDCHSRLEKGSYVRTGWGGILADACWRMEKVWPYVGGSIGGGAMRSLYLLEGSQADWIEEEHALFHKQGFGYVDPYVGLDWCMTNKVHMTFRADWMLAFRRGSLVLPTGPRVYIGFMFCH